MQFNKKLLIFPTSRAIREYLKNLKDNNSLLPTFLTIDEFLKKSLSFSDYKLIDAEQRFLYLKEASNIKGLENLGISNEFSFFFKQSDYLFRFFGEIAAEKINIEAFKDVDTYEFYQEHISVLKQIYDNYLEILEENKAIDKINMNKHYTINSDFINKFDEIGLFYEGYFTNSEFDIIREISQLKQLYITLYCNNYNEKSLQNLEALGFNFKKDFHYIIDLSNKTILEANATPTNHSNVNIEAFSRRTNQVAFIKTQINGMIERGIDPSKIAVVLPDESFASILQLYSSEGYFNYAMGLSIENENVYKCIRTIFEYLNEEETKSIEQLTFFNIDRLHIDKTFKELWNKPLKHKTFIDFFDFLITHEYKDEILEKLGEIKFRLEHLFFHNDEVLTLKQSINILMQHISKITLDDINSGPVTVMGLLETRAVKYDGVIIVDFNESYVPKRSVKDKFLSTALKKHMQLPTPYDRENLQKYYYYRLISQAKEVSISYIKNETMQISRFSNELFSVKNHTTKDESYKQILFNNHHLKHFKDTIVHPMDLKTFRWSATSLKIYLSCQRKFYLRYLANIKEHDNSLLPKPYEIGTIIHDALYKLYNSANKEEYHYDKLLHILNEKPSENAYLILDLEIWKKRLKQFFEYENNRESFEVVDVEKEFLIHHKGVQLKGAIDRIDKVGDEYYILDYKTGTSLSVDTLKNYEKTKDYQLEFYYLACKELLKTEKIKPFYYDLYSNSLKEEVVLEQKLEQLDYILENLPSGDISFDKCEEKKECQYCSYKQICDR